MRRRRSGGALVLALGLWAASTTNASAGILHPRGGGFVAIAPRTSAPAASARSRAGTWGALPAAMPLAGELSPSGYEAAVDRYFSDVAAASRPPSAVDNVYSVTAQYTEQSSDTGSPTAMVSDRCSAGSDAITDHDAFPPDAATGNAAGCQ